MSLLNTVLSSAELKDIMKRCGEVTFTDVGIGHGKVCFSNREEMERCLFEMDGHEINEQKIRVFEWVSYKLLQISQIFNLTIVMKY